MIHPELEPLPKTDILKFEIESFLEKMKYLPGQIKMSNRSENSVKISISFKNHPSELFITLSPWEITTLADKIDHIKEDFIVLPVTSLKIQSAAGGPLFINLTEETPTMESVALSIDPQEKTVLPLPMDFWTLTRFNETKEYLLNKWKNRLSSDYPQFFDKLEKCYKINLPHLFAPDRLSIKGLEKVKESLVHMTDIPHEIHLAWLGSVLPKEYQELLLTWKKHHPGWPLVLWTDATLDQIKNDKQLYLFSKWCKENRVFLIPCSALFYFEDKQKPVEINLQEAFQDACNRRHWGKATDLLRAEILDRLGGVWTDVDNI